MSQMPGLIERSANFMKQMLLSRGEREFIRRNREWSPPNDPTKPNLRILVQMPEDAYYLVLFSSLIRSLKTVYHLEAGWIQLHAAFEVGGFKSWFKKTQFYYRRWIKLFLSNGGTIVYSHVYDEQKIDPSVVNHGATVWSQLKTKNDIFKINYRDVAIGDLIYDSYLRFKPAATVDLRDPFLRTLIIFAMDNVVRQEKLFQSSKYDVLFTTYTSYVHHGVMTRSALKYGVEVITFGDYMRLSKKLTADFPNHSKDYFQYKSLFNSLSSEQRREGVARAKRDLQTRFEGKVDGPTSYMAQSAYHLSGGDQIHFKKTGRKRVVLFLHCFFDSPNIFRYMYYADFYDWVFSTFKILSETEYDIYLKPHPNGLPENEPIVKEILEAFPKINLIPKTVSNLVLIKEGFDLALTVYGTLAHELPYFGIPVLNAGDNPHINYDFCVHPKTREEYEYLLKHIDEIPPVAESAKEQIWEYYYMHNLHIFPGGLSAEEHKYFTEFRYGKERIEKYLARCKEPNYKDEFDRLLFNSVKEIL